MSQSPLALISPLPSPSSHPPSAAILPAWTSTSTSALLPSSSKPVATSASASASASASTPGLLSAASLEAISTAGASESSSALSPSSSKSKATSRLSSATSSEAASVAASASSPLLPSSFETSAAGSSSSPSLRTPLSSTLEIIKSLANDSVSKLKGEEISRIRPLKEAVWIFEDFITRLQILQKPLAEEEFKIIRNSIFKVAVALEEFALNYGKHQMTGANSSVEINSRKLVLAIQKAYCKNASDFYLGKKELQTSLEVSSRNFANNVSAVVGILYKDLHEVLITDQPNRTITGTTRYLDSGITAVALDPNPEKLQENIILRFRNLKIHEGEKKCMFWSGSSESLGGFSETGCHVVTSKSNSEETVCSCNHLTNFAVLLDYNGIPGLTVEDETIHEIITHVGFCLSIFGILLTIILYSYLTDVWQPLTQIRLSLSLSLGAGQIVFLAGINATENTALCVLTAAFLQYFLMVAFCWMLVEEIYFVLFVVKVYNIGTKMHMYHFISWGLPIIMVSISMSIAAGKNGIESYTSEKYCWLSSRNNLIWIFVTFVAAIEVLNILILVRMIKEMSTLTQPTGEDNHLQQIRLGIKTCAVMIPLLGVTWLFGLLLSSHKALAYLFTIFSSTQGILIFVLHCVRNSQIREQLKRKMNIIFPSAVDHGNSAKKSSQVNPRDASEVRAVEMQSFKE
ncbi:adhesion G protein-coupled receptor L3 [Pocillopora verrucosa]|uniref:adhesion G protein-coupled receptor L3 n=1 Tax=Pocillopora verrucosa TaxID=203993 RepID=UPI00334135F8